MEDDVKTINTPAASNPAAAAIDVEARSQAAFLAHHSFFTSAAIESRVDEAYAIIDAFFSVRKNIYINYRANRGKPFVVIKVDHPQFPNVKPSYKQTHFVEPLQALNVERVFSNKTNSWLFYIR